MKNLALTFSGLVALSRIGHAAPPAHNETSEKFWTDASASRASTGPVQMQSFIALARSLGPAVVNIIATQPAEDAHALLQRQQQQGNGGGTPHRGRGQGTGFIINKSGFILTNNHVIEGADDIRVRLQDERELTARLVGTDERTDIALLKIEGDHFPVAPLGNSDDLQIGEWVVAIGNPFGLDHTVTAGIVSAKGRRDVHPGGANSGIYDFIQTDASINPGNSGGPLINTRGMVVGINTAMNAQAQGIGFAIPINMAKVIAPLLKAHGFAPRSWMGVAPQSLNPGLRKAFHLGDKSGALVAEVVADSPAADVGIAPGDLITSFDGKPVKQSDDLTWLVSTTPANKRVPVTLNRGDKAMKVEVMLAATPGESAKTTTPPPATNLKGSALGMTVSEITPGIAREVGESHGVVVMSVEPDSPAVEAGVERGDIILRVNDTKVVTLDDYALIVRKVPHGEMLKILVRRDHRPMWVAFLKR